MVRKGVNFTPLLGVKKRSGLNEMSAGGEKASNERHQELLAKQVAMNGQTLERLIVNGLKPDTQVELDFFFYGNDKGAANKLSEFLKTEKSYAAEATDESGDWAVIGKTGKTRVTKKILDQWVDWMIVAGLKYDFEFDGWGTTAP